MNLMTFLNRGAALSGIHARVIKDRREKLEAHDKFQIAAIEECRKLWMSKLLADQTRAWMSITEVDKGVLQGLCALLTTAGVAKMFDDGESLDSPEVRVIRGAISAATQCAKSGSVISLDDAKAFNTACVHATAIFEHCTLGAIKHAAMQMHAYARQQEQVH